MKKLILTIAVSLIGLAASAQSILKVRAYSTTEKHAYPNGDWSEWSSWRDANILIVIDATKDRITIYSETTQTYDILADEGESLSDRGDKVRTYTCVDENGSRCQIRIVKRTNTAQIYADFSNVILCYNIKSIE
jgi:hypothetical protein